MEINVSVKDKDCIFVLSLRIDVNKGVVYLAN